ncbi:hypothetical protein, partial [Escherichia coli]|uniref:hypothetical protein n=1 Tax=Escherichia coli TaxID=562 RepID=UPI001BC8407A
KKAPAVRGIHHAGIFLTKRQTTIINRINCDKLNISCLTEIITDALRDRKMRAYSKNRQQKIT